MMRFELLPLLDSARASSDCQLVISSIRDILQPKSKPGRNLEICELIDKYYDHVLVHGDQKIADLADSFALAGRIEQKLFYSGYICARSGKSPPASDGVDEVIVSAGGSATGLEILKTSIAARPLSSLGHLTWRLLVSPSIDQFDYDELRRLSGEGIRIERNRPDFSELIKRARLSISQAGYNTVTDILNSTTAAVVVPFAEAGEMEQTMRAQILQRHDRLVMLEQENLSATNLAAAVDSACNRNAMLEVNLAGAQHSAAAVSHWLAEAGSTS
jgi:predicted glycosyltransferase